MYSSEVEIRSLRQRRDETVKAHAFLRQTWFFSFFLPYILSLVPSLWMVHREPERAALSTRNAMKYRLILCSFLQFYFPLTILSSNIIRDISHDWRFRHERRNFREILSNLCYFFFPLSGLLFDFFYFLKQWRTIWYVESHLIWVVSETLAPKSSRKKIGMKETVRK